MKKISAFSLAVVLSSSIAHAACPDATTAQTADYYLSNQYLFQCTALQDTTRADKETCKWNEVGFIKMTNDGWADFHWDGSSACVYENINLSQAGNYDIHWYQRNGGTINLYVNGDSVGTYTAGKSDTLVIYRIAMVAGMNKIVMAKKENWPQSYAIKLSKSSAVIETTTITFDKQNGTGGTATVVATKGDAMPTITVPTLNGYYFEGYYSAAQGGDQYYNPDGTSYKNWDKSDKTYTLYAHWNNGGTEGDCPTEAQAKSENWFFNHMYDARCTELTNTWQKDNGAYIYTNVEGENIKITESGEWLDFYWADPSSIVFDSIYVSQDVVCDFAWYFRCDNIDGDMLDGSTSQIWVNDELFASHTVWISEVEGMDTTVVEGIELYADWPNKIKIVKGNGWPLTRGIKLLGGLTALRNVADVRFFVIARSGQIEINRLEGMSNITICSMTGTKVYETTTQTPSLVVDLQPGAYLVKVNGSVKKAVVR